MGELTFHQPSSEDYDDVRAMLSDWGIVRQLGRLEWPVDANQVQSFCKPVGGNGIVWTIRDNGAYAGRIGVTGGYLGYVLPKSAQGRGVATSAAYYAIGQAFDLLALDVINAGTWEDNPASQRVLQKLGFQRWQTRYERSVARGYPVPVFYHRLTRQGWDRLNDQPT